MARTDSRLRTSLPFAAALGLPLVFALAAAPRAQEPAWPTPPGDAGPDRAAATPGAGGPAAAEQPPPQEAPAETPAPGPDEAEGGKPFNIEATPTPAPAVRRAERTEKAEALAAAGAARVRVPLANVREGPGASHAVLTTVRKGTTLLVLDRSAGWLKVRTADGQEGWIYADLLESDADAAPPGPAGTAQPAPERGPAAESRPEPDAVGFAEIASKLPAGQILNHTAGQTYWILQEAIDSAEPGATLVLGPGRYPGRVVLRKTLYLYGAGMDRTTLELSRSKKDSVWISDECPDGLLSNLELAGGSGTLPVLEISGAFAGAIEACRIRGGRGPGILVSDAAAVSLRGCELAGTGPVAIEIRDKARPRLEFCHIHDGRGGGLVILQEARPLLVGNRILDMGGFGLQVGDTAQPTLEGNEIRRCRHDGVYVYGRAAPTLRGNQIMGNALRRNDTANLSFDDDSAGTVVENDIEAAEKRAGVAVAKDAHPLISANRIRGNRIGILLKDRCFPTLKDNRVEANAEDLVDRRRKPE